MTTPIITIEKLGKKYTLFQESDPGYRRLSEELVAAIKRPFLAGRRPDADVVTQQEEFWALRDVSFEVQRGEVLGIIGRNGAGKSTLLKILSRITEPTEGRACLRGRVASLLEVGTGFHQELTGRETIFLNGAILGMSRKEIRRKFNEIVAFAEVERFLDTPVKRYSSGMYVRLAFAVAAHLEPEILIVDEVLAVGDAAFRKKCLGRMGEVARGGRTVLFVSHNMAAIANLCHRVVLLEDGRVKALTDPQQAVASYSAVTEPTNRVDLRHRKDRQGSGVLRFRSVTFCDEQRRPVDSYGSGQVMRILVRYENVARRYLSNVEIALGINDMHATRITQLNSTACGAQIDLPGTGEGTIEVTVPRLPLNPGRYSVNLFCSVNGEIADWFVDGVAGVDVCEGDYFGTGHLPPAGQGPFLVDHEFSLIKPCGS